MNLNTGVATPLITAANIPGGDFDSPHGLGLLPGLAPQPPTWAVMLIGFGLGAVLRSRRKEVEA